MPREWPKKWQKDKKKKKRKKASCEEKKVVFAWSDEGGEAQRYQDLPGV